MIGLRIGVDLDEFNHRGGENILPYWLRLSITQRFIVLFSLFLYIIKIFHTEIF